MEAEETNLEIKDQETANKVIAEKIEAAYKLIRECEAIADKFECYFSFDLAYGAGASYTPKPNDWQESNQNCSDRDDYGWQASSQSC